MKKLFYVVILFLGLSSAFAEDLPNNALNDPPSVHGMLVVGEGTLYLSHLPMFHSPHDYQVIFEAEIGDEAHEVYLRDKTNHPEETVYTLVPEPFVLPRMVQSPKPFRAKLFRGHFERGGIQIVKSADVRILKVIYAKKFEKGAKHPKNLHYILFGKAGDLFLAHLITAKPDFDQVLGVKINDSSISDRLNSKSHIILEIPGFDNDKPLSDNSTVNATDYRLEDLKQYYLEFDDLSF